MARKVVCKLCKNKGDTDTFYKVTDEKGKNKYYCSQEEYDNYQHEKLKRENMLKFIAEEVFQYEEGQIIHPTMISKLSNLNKFYDNEVIHECFVMNKDTIQYWTSTKNFSNEYGMVSYIMKIIEGSINDVYNKWKHRKTQQVKQEVANLDVQILNDVKQVSHNNESTNGILAFLDEEDM